MANNDESNGEEEYHGEGEHPGMELSDLGTVIYPVTEPDFRLFAYSLVETGGLPLKIHKDDYEP